MARQEACAWGDCPHGGVVEEDDFENKTFDVEEANGVTLYFHYDCAEEYRMNLRYLRDEE